MRPFVVQELRFKTGKRHPPVFHSTRFRRCFVSSFVLFFFCGQVDKRRIYLVALCNFLNEGWLSSRNRFVHFCIVHFGDACVCGLFVAVHSATWFIRRITLLFSNFKGISFPPPSFSCLSHTPSPSCDSCKVDRPNKPNFSLFSASGTFSKILQ